MLKLSSITWFAGRDPALGETAFMMISGIYAMLCSCNLTVSRRERSVSALTCLLMVSRVLLGEFKSVAGGCFRFRISK